MIWAEYAGGEILKGFLIGSCTESGELEFTYQHINVQREVRIGKCNSVPRVLENGKLRLEESWQWLNQDQSSGSSVLIEL